VCMYIYIYIMGLGEELSLQKKVGYTR
jgi:hypothetical protein